MLGITVNIFNRYTQEVEAEGSQIQGQSRLHNEITSKKQGYVVRHGSSQHSGGRAVQSQSRIHSKFKTSQDCSKLCLQTQQRICKEKRGDGDMTHCFRATVALTKDPGSISSTGMVAHKHP